MIQSVFGSKVDWISQHSVFPEYFRQLFYDTGQLFPEYAANIGGGQNIYHFAYYGLLNPLFLPAYFFPSIKMSDYLMVISILCLIADGLLFYTWVRKHAVSRGNGLLVSLLFVLAGPMIFHSYMHVMFVNYMPFLLLALIGVDRYFAKGKADLFTISVFFMIMTSFYFSIGGILVLVLYGVDRFLEREWRQERIVTPGSFLRAGVSFCLPILCAVCMSGVLLLPTAVALVSNAREGEKTVSLLELFVPQIDFPRMLYSAYGIGLTSLVVTVLIAGIFYETWRERYLSIACITLLTVPFFLYLLNGGLYLRDKALIPALPLLCYLIAKYIEKMRTASIPFRKGVVPYVLTIGLLLVAMRSASGNHSQRLYLIDAVCMLVACLLAYSKPTKRWHSLLLLPILFLAMTDYMYTSQKQLLLDRDFYHRVTDSSIKHRIEKVLQADPSYYRLEQSGTREERKANINRIWSPDQYSSSIYSSTYHGGYHTFRTDTFDVEQPYRNDLMQGSVENPVFQKLMGIKYIVSDRMVPGYEQKEEGVFVREDVLPIAYATTQVMTEEDYASLPFPYNETAYLDYAVVSEDRWNQAIHPSCKEWKHFLDQTSLLTENRKEETGIEFVRFRVKNKRPNQDQSISIGSVENKLSAEDHIYYNQNDQFTYAFPLRKESTAVKLQSKTNDYDIEKMERYVWHEAATTSSLCQTEFVVDHAKTKGNRIFGKISLAERGYFITSIPYEENYTITVDGREIPYQKVNTTFLGFPLTEGPHEVEIEYHAPGLFAGKLLSLSGWLFYCILLFYSREKCYNVRRTKKDRIGEWYGF